MDRNIFYVADKTGHEQLTTDKDYRQTEFDYNLYCTG
jgi:predicted nucleic acid-binding protein